MAVTRFSPGYAASGRYVSLAKELKGRFTRDSFHYWVMPLSASYRGTPRLTGFVLGYGGTAVTELTGAVEQLRRLLGTS